MTIGGVQGLTSTYGFTLINFDYPRWHTFEQGNWNKLDGILSGITMGTATQGAWTNSTAYPVNALVVDTSTNPALVYACQVANTSAAAPTTFAQDRAAHPTYWAQVQYNSIINTGFGLSGGPITGSGTIVVDPTALPIGAKRNALWNGTFQVSRRNGTSGFSANNTWTYVVDRWGMASSVNTGNGIVAQVTRNPTTGNSACLVIQRSNGSTVAQTVSVAQVIPTGDSYKYQGKACTLSFLLNVGANFSPASLVANVYSGTGTDQGLTAFASGGWTGQTLLAATAAVPVIGGGNRRYAVNFTVPANATQLGVLFSATYTTTASGVSDILYLSEVQLEIGNFTAPQIVYDQQDYTSEYAATAAFYQTVNVHFTGASVGSGSTLNNTIPYPYGMRTTPTATNVVAPTLNNASSAVFTPLSNVSGISSITGNVAAGTAVSATVWTVGLSAEL